VSTQWTLNEMFAVYCKGHALEIRNDQIYVTCFENYDIGSTVS